MTVTITPIEDNLQYKVNEHTVWNYAGSWSCSTELTQNEKRAWLTYEALVLKNSRFKKHPRSTYKTHSVFKD